MPSAVTAYRIFIASPGGLDDERQAFRKVINDYNESDALDDGALFVPVGWELAPAGMGRPQELINRMVRRCDYFVLLLHDRWGSAPSASGPFTSGTEEEFHIARECFQSGSMRELAVFFKEIDPGKLSDAGPQLQKVLDFRASLEAGRDLMFTRYDRLPVFETRLRFHLGDWRRRHTKAALDGSAKMEGR
jgi:hypothetical protein